MNTTNNTLGSSSLSKKDREELDFLPDSKLCCEDSDREI